MKKALITGITGQDGSYLADFLLEKGYEVHGVVRRSSTENFERIAHLQGQVTLHQADLLDQLSIIEVLREVRPREVYNLAAIRLIDPKGTRFYQASSSEMFGKVHEVPQSETTPFHPRSPYGVAKVYGYWSAINYREAYGLFATNGILFNHESPRRGETFVSRKITRAVARIKAGMQNKLYLGNLEARRDWGYAPDYVEAMWLMLQQPLADDFVIATGESHSVREFLDLAFGRAGLDWHEFV